jgi:hypothetical protein
MLIFVPTSFRAQNSVANPQKAIEKNGLNGGETIMLAEAFGRAKVVPSADFAGTLRDGHPILVEVMPYSGRGNMGHEVVLTKSFQHAGQNWYEMMDSNQGAERRLYLSERELHTIVEESGVVFEPDPGRKPKLLRDSNAP